jgi:hypothetical protein
MSYVERLDKTKMLRQPKAAALARRLKPARAKPELTSEILLIKIGELTELLASPINFLKV